METVPNVQKGTLYGIHVEEFKSKEELKILAYWALTRWQQEFYSG